MQIGSITKVFNATLEADVAFFGSDVDGRATNLLYTPFAMRRSAA
jgi:hypothetical protein